MSASAASGLRACKAVLVLTAAALTTLVVFNNLTDYASNFEFVRHVLSMDTTFPNNSGLWRRIEAPALHHLAYIAIIAVQCFIAAFTWIGGVRMWAARADESQFNASKRYAIVGLTAGVVLYIGGFLGIAGEWFLMWQSRTWNAQDAAMRFALIFSVVLLLVAQRDRE
ncbi:MAG TPA: DUF2165 domain-containing protein [Steroidobacteraceae bacterium]